jgi:hypothetical protein
VIRGHAAADFASRSQSNRERSVSQTPAPFSFKYERQVYGITSDF